jgi:hypothetical protein
MPLGTLWTRLPPAPTYLKAHVVSLRPSGFIEPCRPSAAERPPSGPN